MKIVSDRRMGRSSSLRHQCPVSIKLESDGPLNGESIAWEKCSGVWPKYNLTHRDRKLPGGEVTAVRVKAVLRPGYLAGVVQTPLIRCSYSEESSWNIGMKFMPRSPLKGERGDLCVQRDDALRTIILDTKTLRCYHEQEISA